jgi:hypothetical protein
MTSPCFCDVSLGSVVVNQRILTCFQNQNVSCLSGLTVTGESSDFGITISSSPGFFVALDNVNITAPCGLLITDSSDVIVEFSGSSYIESVAPESAGIECRGSYVTFRGARGNADELMVVGGRLGAGIGSGFNGDCGGLNFGDGIYTVLGG